MDDPFLLAFLSMESDYAASTSFTQNTWTEHTGGLSILPGDTNVAQNNAAAPTPDGTSWMDSSLLAASGIIIMHPLRHPRHLLILLPGHVHTPSVQNTPAAYAMSMDLAPPFVSACKIADDMPCNQPLDGTLVSIRRHLSMHRHKHQAREMVECPWVGCSDKLRWMNIPRHVRSIHLGVRMVCPTCERSFTRSLGLARHIASQQCSVVSGLHGAQDELETGGIPGCNMSE